jgi:hypothetical protein
VFGNLGWGCFGGPKPIGAAGLLRFSLDEPEAEWKFPPPSGGDQIGDCYALNIDGNAAWVYYYPLADIDERLPVGKGLTAPIVSAQRAAPSAQRPAPTPGLTPGDRGVSCR